MNHTPGDEAIDVIDSAKSSTRERQDESREDLHVKELTGSRESRYSKLKLLYLQIGLYNFTLNVIGKKVLH